MKKTIFLAVVATILLASCADEDNATPQPPAAERQDTCALSVGEGTAGDWAD